MSTVSPLKEEYPRKRNIVAPKSELLDCGSSLKEKVVYKSPEAAVPSTGQSVIVRSPTRSLLREKANVDAQC